VEDNQRMYVGKCWLEMFRSLCIAVDQAGGVPPRIEDLNKMTAWDLFNKYATNKIRFVYIKED